MTENLLAIPEEHQITVQLYTDEEAAERFEVDEDVFVPTHEHVIWQDKYALILAPNIYETGELPQHLIDIGMKYLKAEMVGQNEDGINTWGMVAHTKRGKELIERSIKRWEKDIIEMREHFLE